MQEDTTHYLSEVWGHLSFFERFEISCFYFPHCTKMANRYDFQKLLHVVVFEAIIKPYTNFAGIAVKIKELAKAYNVFAIT